MTDRSPDAEVRRLTEALALAERDRQLLGYEIHDSVVQTLTAAAMLLDGAGHEAAFASEESKKSYEGGLRLLRESIAEARRLISEAAAIEWDDRGLVASLGRLVEKFRSHNPLPVEFAHEANELSLPASTQHLLLRIVQEALHNVGKHAKASRATVRVASPRGELEISISDDGIGFEPARVPNRHFGLEGMRERARILGATLEIDSTPGKGTRIIVRLPITTP